MLKQLSTFQLLVLVVLFTFLGFVSPNITLKAEALDFSRMNPVNLLMSEEEQARKKAEEAHAAAAEAERRAKDAQAEANRARSIAEAEARKVEALAKQAEKQAQKETRQPERPVVTAPPVTQKATTEEKSIWNPVNWFAGVEEKETAKPVVQSPASKAAVVESDSTSAQQLPRLAMESVAKDYAAVLETEKGKIYIELYPDAAPLTVANFVKLVNEGFYNRPSMKFHRVVPGFVVQTGDPTGTGAGGSKDRVPLEVKNKLSHDAKGVVAMARSLDPDSATSQFYITLAPQTALDGKYAVFGRVISGLSVLDLIEKDTKLYGVSMVELSKVARDPAPEKKGFKRWLN